MDNNYNEDNENRIEICTDDVWESDELADLAQRLVRKGKLKGDEKDLGKAFANATEAYDRVFAYSENGTLTVVFCSDDPVYMDECAIMNITLYDEVELMLHDDSDTLDGVDDAFYEYIEELMDENGWEMSDGVPGYDGSADDTMVYDDDDCEDIIMEMLDELPNYVTLSPEAIPLINKFRAAMSEPTEFQLVVTSQNVVGMFDIDNPDYDEDDDDSFESLSYSFNVMRMNGGQVSVNLEEDYTNISIPESYITYIEEMLERYGKGGLFGTGEAFVLQTETLQDDALAMQILDGLEGRQKLNADEQAIIQQLKDSYSGYLNRNIILYQGIVQVVCVNGSDTNSLSFFMYTAMGDSIAGATNGNKNTFGRTADKDYKAFLAELLAERGLDKWLNTAQ